MPKQFLVWELCVSAASLSVPPYISHASHFSLPRERSILQKTVSLSSYILQIISYERKENQMIKNFRYPHLKYCHQITGSTYGRIYPTDVLPTMLKDIRYARGQLRTALP